MNKRSKGLQKVRQVRQILILAGEKVEGPGFRPLWTGKGTMAVHQDYFGVADLISWHKDRGFKIHQVTDIADKMIHAKAIFDSGMTADLWCYVPRKGFNRYWVYSDNGEMRIELLGEGIKVCD